MINLMGYLNKQMNLVTCKLSCTEDKCNVFCSQLGTNTWLMCHSDFDELWLEFRQCATISDLAEFVKLAKRADTDALAFIYRFKNK